MTVVRADCDETVPSDDIINCDGIVMTALPLEPDFVTAALGPVACLTFSLQHKLHYYNGL